MRWEAHMRCINRNIVECKGKVDYCAYAIVDGINRNIVECKGSDYWIGDICINRNIVECKGNKIVVKLDSCGQY